MHRVLVTLCLCSSFASFVIDPVMRDGAVDTSPCTADLSEMLVGKIKIMCCRSMGSTWSAFSWRDLHMYVPGLDAVPA